MEPQLYQNLLSLGIPHESINLSWELTHDNKQAWDLLMAAFVPQKQTTQESPFGKPTIGKIRKINQGQRFGFIQCDNIGPDIIFMFSELVDISESYLQTDMQIWCVPKQEHRNGKYGIYAYSISTKMGTTRVDFGTKKTGRQNFNTCVHSRSEHETYVSRNRPNNLVSSSGLWPSEAQSAESSKSLTDTKELVGFDLSRSVPVCFTPQYTVPVAPIGNIKDVSLGQAVKLPENKPQKTKKTQDQEIHYGKIVRITNDFATIQEWNSDTERVLKPQFLQEPHLFLSLAIETKIEYKIDENGILFDANVSKVITHEQVCQQENSTDFFILNKQFTKHESREIEFKSFRDSFINAKNDEALRLIEKYTIAFLNNMKKGSLFFGIEDDGTICGTKLNFNSPREQRDCLNISIDTLMKNCGVDSMLYEIKYHTLYKSKFEGYRVMNDRWVIEVIVNEYKHKTIYETSGKYDKSGTKIAWLKQDGSTVIMTPKMIFSRAQYFSDTVTPNLEHKITEMIKLVQDKLGVTDKSRIITAIVQLRENNQELTLNNIAIKLFSY
jgi:hypothetical protein